MHIKRSKNTKLKLKELRKKYGLALKTQDLARELGKKPQDISRLKFDESFPIKTIKKGRRNYYNADIRTARFITTFLKKRST